VEWLELMVFVNCYSISIVPVGIVTLQKPERQYEDRVVERCLRKDSASKTGV
jgi:hypothetical protein